jgi:hypothetical protein
MTLCCGLCAAAEEAWTDKLFSSLETIQARLDKIEKQQEEIIAKEVDIRQELDRIRVWVHRK